MAVKTNSNDKLILGLKKQIEEKKSLLVKVGKISYTTNCSLPIDGNKVNLHVTNKETLLLCIAKLQSLKLGLNNVLPDEVLIIDGFTVDEWIGDLINKFNSLNLSLEKERLNKLEKKLHDLLSLDTKVSLEIEDLKNSI